MNGVKDASQQPLDIAIIGMAGCFPAARDVTSYWRNILAKVDAVADADPEWVGPCFEAAQDGVPTPDDRSYTIKGGFLRELAQVDPQSFGVMPSVAAGSDPDHLLALQHAHDALADAGYLAKPFNRERAGVILGRGTYGNKALASTMSRNYFLDQAMDLVRALRPDYSPAEVKQLQESLKSQLMPFQAEHIGVLTPNVIAGLIANRLDLMGPSSIVDAACASTLIAVEQAVRELQSGRCDLMITGGIHSHTPPQIFVQFCRINALSRDKIRPFQKGSEGTLLGEGVGMLVLKRRADAERDGDRIYALIRGVGTASDGRAKGLLAPRLEGEVLAMRRAYETSGIDPASVDLIEAHGTGTSIGDRTEIDSLNAVFGGGRAANSIAITAVKSMIGHCMPASGAAALIKTALALHHKVLPPMLCEEPDPTLQLEKTPFTINNETRPWIHGKPHPRRAGVNAFGFGGINSHFVLEEYLSSTPQPAALLHAPMGSELLMLAADSALALASKARQAAAHLQGTAPASLDAVVLAASREAVGPHRLAIVAASAEELLKKLDQAIARLVDSEVSPFKTRNGIHYGVGAAPGKLCFLFPGEGSQYVQMLADVAMHFPCVRDWFDFIERNALERGSPSRAALWFPAPTGLSDGQRRELEDRLYDMDVAAESVFAASMGLHALATELGLVPDALLGHSTGENTALTVARVNRAHQREDIARHMSAFNERYRTLEAAGRIVEGSLLTVGGLNPELRAALLEQLRKPGSAVQLAMDNCPNQVVLFGSSAPVTVLAAELSAQGALCATLPFGRAYHTPLFQPLADAFREYFATLDIGASSTPLYSACSAAPFPTEPDAIRELCCRQWERPVRFTETIQRLYDDGVRVFLEIGPSSNLTAFVGDTLRDQPDVLALASNNRRKGGMAQLHATLAQLFAAGVPFTPSALYRHRQIAPLELMSPPRAPSRLRTSLKLISPMLTVPAALCKPLPMQAPAAAVAPAAPAASVAPTPLAATAAVHRQNGPASAPCDARLVALESHFSLMQDFLDSQARVLGLVTEVPQAASAASAPPVRHPLLGPASEQSPQRLVCERVFDVDHDLFLRDHAIGSPPSPRDPTLLPLAVIPFTFSMELVAEAASKLVDRAGWVVVALDNARGSRWLSLDHGQIRLRIAAELATLEAERAGVSCRVFLLGEGSTPGGMLVFEGLATLAARYPAAPPAAPWSANDQQPPRWHTAGQIYRHGMFHGPRLQGCTAVHRWGEGGMEAELTALPTHDYFAGITPQFEFDPALLDAAGQIAGFWLRERYAEVRNCFPFRVRQLRLFGPPPAPGSRLTCRGRIAMQGETQLEASWEILDANGAVHMQASGWEDRVFTVPDRFHAFRSQPDRAPLSEPALAGLLPAELCLRRLPALPEGLLDDGGSIWKRVVAHMVLSRAERALFYALPTHGPQREHWLMGRLCAKDAVRDWLALQGKPALSAAEVEILDDARGQPLVRIAALPLEPAPSVAISQGDGETLALVSTTGVTLGVQAQRLASVDTDALIRNSFIAAEQHWLALPAGERGFAAVALACAKAAAVQAAGQSVGARPQEWPVVAAHLQSQAGLPSMARIRHPLGDYDVALHHDTGHPDGRVIALCVHEAPPALPVAAAELQPLFPSATPSSR